MNNNGQGLLVPAGSCFRSTMCSTTLEPWKHTLQTCACTCLPACKSQIHCPTAQSPNCYATAFGAGLDLAPELAAALPRALPSLMLLAITWSLGASCDKAGRAVFNGFLRTKLDSLVAQGGVLQQLPADAVMPASAMVYDWCFDQQVSVFQ